MTLGVLTSDLFDAAFAEMGRRATADPRSGHAIFFLALKPILARLADPAYALAANTVLAKKGNHELHRVRRLKFPPTGRLFYLATAEHSIVYVLEMGYRQPGLPSDAYEELAKHLREGRHDAHFSAIGLPRPRY